MKIFIFSLFLISAIAIQIIWTTNFIAYNATPSVLLVISVWLSFQKNETRALTFIIIGGLFLDFYSGGYFGVCTLTLTSIYLILKYLLVNFLSKEPNIFISLTILILSTLGYQLLFVLYSDILSFLLLQESQESYIHWIKYLAIPTLENLAIYLLFAPLLQKYYPKF